MTTKFSQYLAEQQLLTEHFVNAFKSEEKRKYMQEVWDILQASYAYIGGIKGQEFDKPESMLQIPFWKLAVKNGKVIAVKLYKDHNGRKSIAGGTDGSKEGKDALAKTFAADFKVSYFEVSGAAEGFIKKTFPELYKKYRIPVDQVANIIKKEVKPVDEFHYERMLGGHPHVKILLGTPGVKFYGELASIG